MRVPKIDQRAVAILIAAVAFGAGSFAARDRTNQAVDDQAKVEKVIRSDAKDVLAEDRELTRFNLAFRACRTENVNRANNRLSEPSPRPEKAAREQLNRIKYTEPILDCTATAANLNKPVELSRTEAVKYIQLVGRSRFPIVRNGKVVGSEKF